MNVIQKIAAKAKNVYDVAPVTIAFLGDSVTHGCFECYLTSPTTLETVYDYKSAYSTRLKEILNILFPTVQINVINSGISGDNAVRGAERLKRDVLAYNPNLVVVSYGLNDSAQGVDGLSRYQNALTEIFAKLQEKGIESIFLTQNVMNSKVSPHLTDKLFIDLANSFADNIQNNGLLHEYFERAKQVCAGYGVKVCDLHAVWEKWNSVGVDTTELLSNKLNHPIREIHYYMAMKLMETMFEI